MLRPGLYRTGLQWSRRVRSVRVRSSSLEDKTYSPSSSCFYLGLVATVAEKGGALSSETRFRKPHTRAMITDDDIFVRRTVISDDSSPCDHKPRTLMCYKNPPRREARDFLP
ncbi:hypothetical protein EYF80_065119 [Liparis tanakae]|uniref:Uncharacterized protein n=1 Tax=Liparis tanakae TaxID=230148 RepID=A0A4Z2E7M1_9TELE|nr:hypothetical protein EYF80_065119 [Liparis tanakae]